MVQRIKSIKLLVGAVQVIAMSFVAVLFVTGSAFAATKPTTQYTITNLISGGWTQEHLKVTANPSNFQLRAFNLCSDASEPAGPWVQAVGSFTTAVCRNGSHIDISGLQWSPTGIQQKDCWSPGEPATGTC